MGVSIVLIVFLKNILFVYVTSTEIEYQGCFGIDLLVSKVLQYNPSHECLDRCEKEGTDQVVVAGARWCGCGSSVAPVSGSDDCEPHCSFVSIPACGCFHEDKTNYDVAVQQLLSKYADHLMKLTTYNGQRCIDAPQQDVEDINPSDIKGRAQKCFSTQCPQLNRKYGVYYSGYKCGCKKTNSPYDDIFLPVTKDCLDQMVCMETPNSVCLCGDDTTKPLFGASVTEHSPQLVPDKYQCYIMNQAKQEAKLQRIVEYGIAISDRTKPPECVQACVKKQYRFAGISRGGVCACQNSRGRNKFTSEDCWSVCSAGGSGCGGPYTASVYTLKGDMDLDECKGGTDNCDRLSTVCRKTPSNFVCECRAGYQRLDRTHCQDYNECSDQLNDCDHFTTVCENTVGSFYCLCRGGFQLLNRTHCRDVDECQTGSATCGEHEMCSNTVGSYTCPCVPGFKLYNQGCVDVDECSDYSNDCDPKSTLCKNTVGSFDCECRVGFQRMDLRHCEDIDECETGLGHCGNIRRCSNTIGSFSCICVPGFRADGKNCKDIDECIEHVHDCDSSSAFCKNTIGSYLCECKVGHTALDHKRCQDIDECLTYQNLCTKCINTIGSYVCDCLSGYKITDNGCVDIDECGDTKTCSDKGRCMNTEGSYMCDCYPGYTKEAGSITNCVDVDECSDPKLNECCGPHSQCYNTVGSYTCPCNWGYSGDGRSNCLDEDECETGKARCSDHAACSNTQGSYTCACRTGFSGDGTVCKEVISLQDLEILLQGVVENVDTREKLGSVMIVEGTTKISGDISELEQLLNGVTESSGNRPTLPPLTSLDLVTQSLMSKINVLTKTDEQDMNKDQLPDTVDGKALIGSVALKDMLDSIEIDINSAEQTSAKKADISETNMDLALDDIVDHEKKILSKLDQQQVFVPQTDATVVKTGGESKIPSDSVMETVELKVDDPVIEETIESILQGPLDADYFVPMVASVSDEKMLHDLVEGPQLVTTEPTVTVSNMDVVLDEIMIHEQSILSATRSPKYTSSLVPVIPTTENLGKSVARSELPEIKEGDLGSKKLELVGDLIDITKDILATGQHVSLSDDYDYDDHFIDDTPGPDEHYGTTDDDYEFPPIADTVINPLTLPVVKTDVLKRSAPEFHPEDVNKTLGNWPFSATISKESFLVVGGVVIFVLTCSIVLVCVLMWCNSSDSRGGRQRCQWLRMTEVRRSRCWQRQSSLTRQDVHTSELDANIA